MYILYMYVKLRSNSEPIAIQQTKTPTEQMAEKQHKAK